MSFIDSADILLTTNWLLSESAAGKLRGHGSAFLLLLNICLQVVVGQVLMTENIQVSWLLKVGAKLACTRGQVMLLGREVFACGTRVAIVSLVESVAVSYTHLTLPTKRIV